MIELPVFNPDIFVLAGFLHIKWYGFMYVLGFLSAWILAKKRIEECDIDLDGLLDYFTYFAMGIVIGGRVGYVLFYNYTFFLSNPWSIFEIWKGGMAFHGALIGGLIAVLAFSMSRGVSFFSLVDLTVPLLPPGLMFGRLGNFINGELWGRVTSVPWAMIFPHSDGLPRHPSQLYAMIGEGVLLFVLLSFHRNRNQSGSGILGAWFLIHYGWIRFFIEFFREPDEHIGFVLFDAFSLGQCFCFIMFLCGLSWLLLSQFCKKDLKGQYSY
ncbi:MAG: prolipoprotein diacylglyceryl transferase [Pseudomonadota bacterium]|nr:prolipoprotein diacylglyceryl transferase [Pseudomonadota bacterium]